MGLISSHYWIPRGDVGAVSPHFHLIVALTSCLLLSCAKDGIIFSHSPVHFKSERLQKPWKNGTGQQGCWKLFRAAGANRVLEASRVVEANRAKEAFCHVLLFFWQY